MKTIPNFLRNADEIIKHLERHQHLFKPRIGADTHTSIIPGLYSRFHTLKDGDMDSGLFSAIFADSDFDDLLVDTYNFIQIQKYEPGDFIIPHKDVYSITKLHLVTLTTSSVDGLVIEDGAGGLIKIIDSAGQKIDDIGNLYHWVDPVLSTRYSLVIAE